MIETAQILERTFRKSDVVARIGGDEFAVLAIEASGTSAARLVDRVLENLETTYAQQNNQYRLSLSIGVACYIPDAPCSIEELMRIADERMYEHKRTGRNHRAAATKSEP